MIAMEIQCLRLGFNNEIATAPPLREIRVTFRRVPINVFTDTGARRIERGAEIFQFHCDRDMEGRRNVQLLAQRS